MAATVVVALVAASVAGSIASTHPDGLEWSIERTTDGAEIADNQTIAHRSAAALQRSTALMPDYEASMAGLVGVGATVALVFALTRLVRRR